MLPNTLISQSAEIARALQTNIPIVALESTVITHGLPHPQNIQLARDMEAAIRGEGATPATIALINGKIRIGLTDEELVQLAETKSPLKVKSPRLCDSRLLKSLAAEQRSPEQCLPRIRLASKFLQPAALAAYIKKALSMFQLI